MSYLNQSVGAGSRVAAIAGVVAVHAAVGAALVVGLTVAGVAPPIDTWDPFTITPERKPPPPPPEQPKQTETSYITVTPRAVELPTDSTVEATVQPEVVDTVIRDIEVPYVIPTPQPSVTAQFTPKGVRPANRRENWVTTDDYPRQPLMDEIEGLTGYALVVGTNGKVSSCEVTTSSGNRALDQATCKYITSRARFEPATDETGAKVLGRYSGTVRWEIPD